MYRNILVLSVSISLLGCAASNSGAGNSALAKDSSALPLRSDMQHIRLDNGLNVYLLSRNQPGVEMRLLVESGSLQENEKQLGLAHFTEHMAFKGTTHFPGTSGFKQLEQQGLKLGSHVNAVTSLNSTVYKLSLPNSTPEQLKSGLQVMADWAQGMTFDPIEFDKERPVIVEEWRLRQGIGFRINNGLEQLRYAGSRYAQRDPIGSLDIVRQAPVEEAKNYYQTWYQPQRMSLVIIGNFNSNTVNKDVAHYFALPKPQQINHDDPNWKKFAPQSDLLVKPIFDKEQGSRFVQFSLQRDLTNPLNTRGGQYDDMLDSLWISILNQRLTTLVDNGLIPAASINPQGAMLDNHRSQQLMIVHPAGQDYQGALKYLWTEVQRLATNPVTQDELDSARQALLARVSQQAANEERYQNDYLANQITNALEYQMPVIDKKQQLKLSWDLLKNVKPADLQHHVANILETASPRLALIGPDSDSAQYRETDIQTLWSQIRQSNPGVFALHARNVELNVTPAASGRIEQKNDLPISNTQEWRLSNGIRVIVNNDKNLKDEIQVSLRIPGGRSLETLQSGGLVDWALKLPESSGYGDYSARELSLFAKQHSLQLYPYSELLFHGFRGEAPIDELDTVLKLLHLKMTQPQFSGEKLEKNKQNFALSLSKQPVERQFLDYINLESHTNGAKLIIDPKGSWNNFTAQQLQQNNRLLLSPTQDMTLVISGALNRNQVQQAVEKWVASIPASQSRLQWQNPQIMPKMQNMTKTYPIASSDKSMVSIQYAAPAQWSQQEMLALQLLDSIISQRLRFELREKASGIYALSFSEMLAKMPTPYYSARLNFTTSPERANEMTALANKVIRTTQQQGVTEHELTEAKNTWIIERQQVQQSASYWTDSLAQVATDDNNFDRLTHEQAMIKKLTVNDLNRAAKQYLGQNEKVFKLTPP